MSDMYTEKVKDHFMNPRNVGEIKDADGVGTVGNPTCVVPDTNVISNPATIQISNIDIGEKVLSHDGKFHKITQKFERKYQGNILMIKNRLGKTILTPDHLIYGIQVPKTHKYCYNKNKRQLVDFITWQHSNDLKKNDIVAYPIPLKVKDVEYIDVKQKKLAYDFKSVGIPAKLKIDEEFMRFAGYFLAEGYTRIQKCKTDAVLCFNINEKKYVSDCVNLVRKIFDFNAKVVEYPKHNKSNVIIYNVHVTRFLREMFGNGARNKKIPNFMMFLPLKKQSELIKGLWYGDGHVDQNRFRASYSTISKQLSQQIKLLLLRQGIIPSVYEEKPRNSNGVNHQKAYRIYVLDTPSMKKLTSILNIDFTFRDKISCNAWIENKYLYTPITEIKEINYNGPVHNLEVSESHSYTTNSLLIHNCGDVMSIYIKVKDNKIADIKFKTFGCAAAIASSSIATELVKGKTLDEAEKLSRDDVANELGGLPAIKMHCSNLAADALREAIKDYRKKQKK